MWWRLRACAAIFCKGSTSWREVKLHRVGRDARETHSLVAHVRDEDRDLSTNLTKYVAKTLAVLLGRKIGYCCAGVPSTRGTVKLEVSRPVTGGLCRELKGVYHS
jgi:hypothetical protein